MKSFKIVEVTPDHAEFLISMIHVSLSYHLVNN